jgi:hypothetical protein
MVVRPKLLGKHTIAEVTGEFARERLKWAASSRQCRFRDPAKAITDKGLKHERRPFG